LVAACALGFATYEYSSYAATNNYVASALSGSVVSRAPALAASRRSSGQAPPPKTGGFSWPGAAEVDQTPAPAPKRTRKSFDSSGLENVGQIAGVGTKVVTDLALYLAFNTAYFVGNTYKYLSAEERKALAKETVDKQLPELLSLIGATTGEISSISSSVASTEEFKELQQSAAAAAKKLNKDGTATPEVVSKVKDLLADDKGEVLSEERKLAISEVLKKGGVKATELSLYLFYNVFTVLKNLDAVLPTESQVGGIDAKVEQLQEKSLDLLDQVKNLPSKGDDIAETIEGIKASIPTAEELANVDPAEVSLSVRANLGKAKESVDKAIASTNEALKEDSPLRKNLLEIQTKLKPVTDKLGELVQKLPLPRNEDGSINFSKLLAESGIITVKGIKALISATQASAGSVQKKVEAKEAAVEAVEAKKSE
jgi:hypothetical protein